MYQQNRRIPPHDNALPRSSSSDDDYARRVGYFLEHTATLRGQVESHRRLSADQEAILNGLAESLGIDTPLDENYLIYRELWAAENDEQVYLAVVENAHPHLAREQCCFMEPAVWRHPDNNDSLAGGARFSTPFPLTKYASYLIGSVQPRYRAVEGTREMASGTLYITGLRLFFDSETLSTSINFSGIVNVECYANGLEVGKATGRTEFFQMTALASQYAYMIIQELNRLR